MDDRNRVGEDSKRVGCWSLSNRRAGIGVSERGKRGDVLKGVRKGRRAKTTTKASEAVQQEIRRRIEEIDGGEALDTKHVGTLECHLVEFFRTGELVVHHSDSTLIRL